MAHGAHGEPEDPMPEREFPELSAPEVIFHQKLTVFLFNFRGSTKNDFFQSTVPVFIISTREIPVNIKETLRVFDETSRIQTEKKWVAVGLQMAVGFLFLVF